MLKMFRYIVCVLFLCAVPLQLEGATKQKKTTAVRNSKKSKKRSTYKPPVRLKKGQKKKKAASKKTVSKRTTPTKKRVSKKTAKRPTKGAAPKKRRVATKKPAAKTPLIVIDPGHGGFDLGASSNAVIEKILCLSTGQLLKKHLNTLGYRVVSTRTRDVFLSLKRRTEIANSVRGKLFVSIHYNAAKSASASGIEVYYYTAKDQYRARESQKLAKAVLARMLHQTGALSRGVKRGNFHVIRETTMPAVLVECGFITNAKERQRISDYKYRDKIARAIADGIDRYCKGKP